MTNAFPPKDPAAVLDYLVDWSAWLAQGETITNADVTVPDGLTLNPGGKQTTRDDGKVSFWLAGGVDGMAYAVGCRITTSAGRTDERTFRLPVQNR